jgi:hypothetical protein
MIKGVLYAQRINNGQSELWFDAAPDRRRTVATNSIVYPIRTLCPLEESESFYKAFAEGAAAVPLEVASKLAVDLTF